jgi:hypothetical protein
MLLHFPGKPELPKLTSAEISALVLGWPGPAPQKTLRERCIDGRKSSVVNIRDTA